MPYLRRDGDAPELSNAALIAREWRELRGDVTAARRTWTKRGGTRLAWHLAAFHLQMATGKFRRSRVTSVQLQTADGPAVTAHFRVSPSDAFVLREILVQNIYDYPYQEQVGTVRRILDLGSNIGLSPLYFSMLYPTAQVTCVEPVADNVRLLRRNCAANAFSWRIEEAAVAAVAGTVTLFPNGWSASSSTTRAVAQARTSNAIRPEHALRQEPVTVRATTVEQLLADAGWDRADIVKMDIEGAEEEVLLRGDTAWLDRVSVLALDIHAKYVSKAAIVEKLRRHGFHPAGESGAHSAVFVASAQHPSRRP